jgi:hypothetical protein
MNRTLTWLSVLTLTLSGAVLSGCDDGPAAPLAPAASSLEAPKPAPSAALTLAIMKSPSNVEFTMEAPQEKIRGRVRDAATGELHVDPKDLTKTTGLITVDISDIALYQTKIGPDGKPGAEAKQPLQNQHAREWLEIGEDAPADARAKNARVEFSITSIEDASAKDVTALAGADRKVTLKAKGDFLLHGHKTQKVAELEATFHYEGDKLAGVAVKTVKPFAVGLAENDVRPREAFGKLAQKGLEALAPKVAKEALVSIELRAAAPGMTMPASTAAPEASAAPAAASASAAPAASAKAAPH